MNPYQNNPILVKLARRVLDISYRNKLSHIGSCLTSLPIIYEVYRNKNTIDKVILSAGHGGLALYIVLEHFGYIDDAEKVLKRDGIHPIFNKNEQIDCTTGSLGQGITIGTGYALSNRARQIYVISSDGELAEGSFWGSLFFKWKINLDNLHVLINANGWTALDKSKIPYNQLSSMGAHVYNTSEYTPNHLSWFKDLDQHYQVMNESQYKELDEYYANLV